MVVDARVDVQHETNESPDEHDDNPLDDVANVGAGELFEAEFDLDERFNKDSHDVQLENVMKRRVVRRSYPAVIPKPFASRIRDVDVPLLDGRH